MTRIDKTSGDIFVFSENLAKSLINIEEFQEDHELSNQSFSKLNLLSCGLSHLLNQTKLNKPQKSLC